MQVGLPLIKYIIDDNNTDAALHWLYPPHLTFSDCCTQTAILTATNDSVDKWNSNVQNLNPHQINVLFSHDQLCDVDDPHGHLALCLTESVLNKFNSNGIPPHILQLKLFDICFVTRAMKSINLASNSRVKILSISNKIIRVQVLNDPNRRTELIPKIRFKFRMKFGQSYQMLRTQFPLRIAYAFTYNKAQSQTINKVFVDCTAPPFDHGHLYVSLSRHRNPDNIKLFVTESQLHENPYFIKGEIEHQEFMPVITNIVYPRVLKATEIN